MGKKLIAVIILFSFHLSAQDKGFGLGFIAGEPTGISMKLWLNGNNAIDAGLAWSFVNKSSLHIHADYLYHFEVIKVSEGKLPFYTGIGGRLKLKNENKSLADNRIGVRVPLGINYIFADAPLDIFLEIVPVIDLSPKTDMTFNSALGARYFFK